MIKRYYSLTIFLLLLLYGCGFKAVDQNASNNFEIVEIETKCDNRINFKIKNRLLYNSKENFRKPLSIEIRTEKNKKTMERNGNIQNQITKYEIQIEVEVSFAEINNQREYQFNILKTSTYAVAKQYSQTLKNEKKLVELMTEDLIDDILEEINNRLNDL